MQDAGEVMQLLLEVHTKQEQELKDDDPHVSSHTHCLQVMMSFFVALESLHAQCFS